MTITREHDEQTDVAFFRLLWPTRIGPAQCTVLDAHVLQSPKADVIACLGASH